MFWQFHQLAAQFWLWTLVVLSCTWPEVGIWELEDMHLFSGLRELRGDSEGLQTVNVVCKYRFISTDFNIALHVTGGKSKLFWQLVCAKRPDPTSDFLPKSEMKKEIIQCLLLWSNTHNTLSYFARFKAKNANGLDLIKDYILLLWKVNNNNNNNNT